MNKPNFKIYIVLALTVLGGLIIFSFILPLVNPKKEEVTPTPGFPTPTSIELQFTPKPTAKSAPSIIHPTGFTGVKEEELPPDIKTLSEQKQALKRNVPLTQAQFTIEFDFTTDKFSVTLQEPKDQSRLVFTDWLKTNYPAIPLDRFTFK